LELILFIISLTTPLSLLFKKALINEEPIAVRPNKDNIAKPFVTNANTLPKTNGAINGPIDNNPKKANTPPPPPPPPLLLLS